MLSFCNRQVVAMLCLVAGFAWSCAQKDTLLPLPTQEPFVWTSAIYNVRSDSFFKIRVDSLKSINSRFNHKDLLHNIAIKFSWGAGSIENFKRKAYLYDTYNLDTGSPVYAGKDSFYFYGTKVTTTLPIGQTYELELKQPNQPTMLARTILRDTPMVSLIKTESYKSSNYYGFLSYLHTFKVKLPDPTKNHYYVVYISKNGRFNSNGIYDAIHPNYPNGQGLLLQSVNKGYKCLYRPQAWVVAVPPSTTSEQIFQVPFGLSSKEVELEISEVSYAFYLTYKNGYQNFEADQYIPFSPLLSNFIQGKGLFELLNPARVISKT
jgi:hypothetical protein